MLRITLHITPQHSCHRYEMMTYMCSSYFFFRMEDWKRESTRFTNT